MSYTRNLAGAAALLASSSLLGLGCMAAVDDKSDDPADQSLVTDDAAKADEQGLTRSDDSVASRETTGESKDALWGRGFGGYGRGFGFGGYGRGFGGYGRGFGFGGYGRGFGFGGYGRGFYGGHGYPGYGYGGYGYPVYGGYGCGYPVYGYPVYGGYGGCGGCGYGC